MNDLRRVSRIHRITGAVFLWRDIAEETENVWVRRGVTVSQAKTAFF
jgi:hypothetical protein